MSRRLGHFGVFALAGFVGLAAAGSPAPVGSLVGSRNATLDGQAPLPHTTVLSGDNLQVSDGFAMLTLDQGNRMILGSGSAASFSREMDGVTVSMTRGKLTLYHPQAGTGFRVKIGAVTVRPTQKHRTLGEIAMVNGLLQVTAKDGSLQVEKAGATKEVSKGKTITIPTAAAGGIRPSPSPSGNAHVDRDAVETLGFVAGGAATAFATVALTRSIKSVSPVTPTP